MQQRTRQYFEQYPELYWKHLRAAQKPRMILSSIGIALFGASSFMYIYTYCSEGKVILALGGIFTGFLTILCIYALLRSWWMKPRARIVLYFKKIENKIKDETKTLDSKQRKLVTFDRGYGIASNFKQLDDIVCNVGLKPLSSFGFGDDMILNDVEVCWHKPDDCLKTVRYLIKYIEETTNISLINVQELLEDLKQWEIALFNALKENILICILLIIQSNASRSSVEIEARAGTFWL